MAMRPIIITLGIEPHELAGDVQGSRVYVLDYSMTAHVD